MDNACFGARGIEGVGDSTVAALGDRAQGRAITGAITDCGHFLREECPDQLTEVVLKFRQSTPR
jgi:pimeloyl-ACP methyl ester carboxylesterase